MTPEQNFTNGLISGLANLPATLTREEVEAKATAFAKVFDYTGDLSPIIDEAMKRQELRKQLDN